MAQQLIELGNQSEEDVEAKVVPLKSARKIEPKQEIKKESKRNEEKENGNQNQQLFGNAWTFTEQKKENNKYD